MKLKHITRTLEEWAPPSYQESYDNSKLICGDPEQEISTALCTLDCTEAVIEEALEKGANLIIAHHPIVFTGLTSLTGKNYVERTVIAAIRNNIAIYALHTNLDAIETGVNQEIGQRLGLNNLEILKPKAGLLQKIVVFVPNEYAVTLRKAMFDAGAGSIGDYDHCSFNGPGTGTFRGSENSSPFVGKPGEDHKEAEVRVEVICETHRTFQVIDAMREVHPYEEVAYDVYALQNTQPQVGSGMIGKLSSEMDYEAFLKHLALTFGASVLRHTGKTKATVQRIAFCGGSGSFLLQDAIRKNADVFITGDFKYHQFFDAEDEISIIDIGHFEFEQFTPHLIQAYLAKKFPTFAVLLSGAKTNPVQYFIS